MQMKCSKSSVFNVKPCENELKKASKRGLDIEIIKAVMRDLINEKPLAEKHRNHNIPIPSLILIPILLVDGSFEEGKGGLFDGFGKGWMGVRGIAKLLGGHLFF